MFAPWVEMFGLKAPYGKCQCGCGEDTQVAKKSRPERGIIRGEPIRCVMGHSATNGREWASIQDAYNSYVAERGKEECWQWQGNRGGNGYGYVTVKGKRWLAHRLSYTVNYGPIPNGLHCLHRCDNGPEGCVNPNHLFLGTHRDNMNDMVQKRRNAFGERSGASKLTDEKVRQIKRLLSDRQETYEQIADRYGVGRKTIESIANGSTWQHIDGPLAQQINGRSVMNRGGRNRTARLTEEDVKHIRQLIAAGEVTQREIARRYGVADSTISAVKHGQNWK